MSDDSKLWYVYVQEQTYGPIDSQTLIQWYKEKRLENGFVHDGIDWRQPDDISILKELEFTAQLEQPLNNIIPDNNTTFVENTEIVKNENTKPLFQDLREYTQSTRDMPTAKTNHFLRRIVLIVLFISVIATAAYFFIGDEKIEVMIESVIESEEKKSVTAQKRIPSPVKKPKETIGTITFLGAASQVCGASFFVDYKFHRLLIDAGLFYSNPETNRAIRQDEILPVHTNINFPPKIIDSIIITHAHIDHIGRLPYFYTMGMNAQLYMTRPTKDILMAMLRDTFKYSDMPYDNLFYDKNNDRVIHSRLLECPDARQIIPHNLGRVIQGRWTSTQSENKLLCLVCAEIELKQITDRIVTVNYFEPVEIAEKITAYFYPAAHILGSAWVYIEYKYDKEKPPHVIAASGDMGELNNTTYPLSIFEDKTADVVLVESTYGVGFGDAKKEMKDEVDMDNFIPFLEMIQKSIEEERLILIPAFVLDRAHRLMLVLQWGLQKKIIDNNVPIFLTSSTTRELIPVYQQYYNQPNNENYYKKDFIDIFNKYKLEPFISSNFKFGSERVYPRPAIIIGHSAMMDHGEALRLGREFIEDDKFHIIFVGYASPWSVGGRIKNSKDNKVNIFGTQYDIKAKISSFHVFSGHAQGQTLGTWVNSLKPKTQVFVNHGERNVSIRLADYLKKEFNIKADVIVPKYEESFNLDIY